MKLSSNPFSLYDLIGYLFTGFIFSYLVNCFFKYEIIEFESFEIFKQNGMTGSVEIKAFFYLVLSYLTGHILSFLSSFTIERYNIFIYGYPSNYLIKKADDKVGWKSYLKRSFGFKKFTLRLLLLIILAPLVLIDVFLGHFIGMKLFLTRSYSDDLVKLIIKKAEIVYENEFFLPEDHVDESYLVNDSYLPLYHYVILNSERHFSRTQNYVALYGVLRNTSFVSLILCWLMIFNFNDFLNDKWFLIPLTAFLSFLCFLGYVKFYRNLTEEVYFGMLSIKRRRENND